MIKKILLNLRNQTKTLDLKKHQRNRGFYIFASITNNKKENEKNKLDAIPPELPITCCMSNCQNCVWLQYAEDLLKYYGKLDKKNMSKALKEIEKLEDENMKNFLLMEIRMKMKS
jgi:hypothetical protein